MILVATFLVSVFRSGDSIKRYANVIRFLEKKL